MDELTVIGAENGALIVVSADGARFRVPITEALHTALRQNRPPAPAAHSIPPREIQALIRQGLTAQEVAAQTREPLEYIQRFEGPVLAEREYVVTAARTVPVAVVAEPEPGTTGTFGSVIDRRLSAIGARDVRWESRKVDTHWQVSVSFLDGETARTAAWSFDPKKAVLAPTNHEAHSLSQQGDGAAPVLPRLRAVPADADSSSRFDSGAFAPLLDGARPDGARTADGEGAPSGQTADLLEALRRRRGEREPASTEEWESARAAHPSTGSIRIVEIPLSPQADDDSGTDDTVEVPAARASDSAIDDAALTGSDPAPETAPVDPPATKSSSRRGRPAMPSWDEIVFGARPDDDPA